MDIVIFTGRMDVEELKEDKPLEYAAMKKSGELRNNLADAYPPIVTRVIRAFGWTAVVLGLSTVVVIIYAMLFAYR